MLHKPLEPQFCPWILEIPLELFIVIMYIRVQETGIGQVKLAKPNRNKSLLKHFFYTGASRITRLFYRNM